MTRTCMMCKYCRVKNYEGVCGFGYCDKLKDEVELDNICREFKEK